MVMKHCGPVHASQSAIDRHQKAESPVDGLEDKGPTRHRRPTKSIHTSLDTRSISPTMPSSSRSVGRRGRSSRRDTNQDDDDGRLRSKSSYQRERSCAPKSRGKSQSRFSSKNKFSDPPHLFDVNGYCVIHKDVRMAKLKCDEWKILRDECPKCVKMNGSCNLSGSITDRTENSTQDDSFDSPPQTDSRRRSVRPSYRDEQQEVCRSGNSFHSTDDPREVGSRRKSVRPSYRDEQQNVRRSDKSFYSIDESREVGSRRTSTRPSYKDEQHEVRKSGNSFYSESQGTFLLRRRRARVHPNDEIVVRRSNNSIHSSLTTRRSTRMSSQYDNYEDEAFAEEEEEFVDEEASYDDRSRRDHAREDERRGRDDRARSKSRARMPKRSPSRGALSRVSRGSRSGGEHRSDKYVSRPKPKTICVNGVPFDKNGCCFVHPHVKLASKKLLGGWRVHHTFCRACATEAQEENDDASALTSRSGYTSRSGHSSARSRGTSRRSGYDDALSAAESVVHSVRSLRSNISTASWASNQSRKKVKKDDFLPLDKDGYCTHHPDVQLAKVGQRGEWKVLMDFCPECAEASLMIGGAVGSKSTRSKSRSSQRNCDESTVKSAKSTHSDTLVKKMPFIDNDGKPGHYTGYLDLDGRPNGRGKMNYIDGKKFDGIWKAGNQVQGKVSYKKKSVNTDEKKKNSRRSAIS
ncbi:hypothetical protein ACHAWO_013593 [Cyclotella atomus]|uniref:Uncharacterized protein n=1 Tax=Cyclotella atomus TaxID=382360 RepID=A0ABD3PTL5_9STRA